MAKFSLFLSLLVFKEGCGLVYRQVSDEVEYSCTVSAFTETPNEVVYTHRLTPAKLAKLTDADFDTRVTVNPPSVQKIIKIASIRRKLLQGITNIFKVNFNFKPETSLSYAHLIFELPVLQENQTSTVVRINLQIEDVTQNVYTKSIWRQSVSRNHVLGPLLVFPDQHVKRLTLTVSYETLAFGTNPLKIIDFIPYVPQNRSTEDYFYSFRDENRDFQINPRCVTDLNLIQKDSTRKDFTDGDLDTGLNCLVSTSGSNKLPGSEKVIVFASAEACKKPVHVACVSVFQTLGQEYVTYSDVHVHGLYERRPNWPKTTTASLTANSFLGTMDSNIKCFHNTAPNFVSGQTYFHFILTSRTNSLFVAEVRFYTESTWLSHYFQNDKQLFLSNFVQRALKKKCRPVCLCRKTSDFITVDRNAVIENRPPKKQNPTFNEEDFAEKISTEQTKKREKLEKTWIICWVLMMTPGLAVLTFFLYFFVQIFRD